MDTTNNLFKKINEQIQRLNYLVKTRIIIQTIQTKFPELEKLK